MLKKIYALAVLSVLSGCAGIQLQSDEDAVFKRAEQRMTALQALDFKKAYGYMSPGYRASNSLTAFSAQFAGAANIVSFNVMEPECTPDRCTVVVERIFKAFINARGQQGERELEAYMQEVWIKTSGKWWYYGLK